VTAVRNTVRENSILIPHSTDPACMNHFHIYIRLTQTAVYWYACLSNSAPLMWLMASPVCVHLVVSSVVMQGMGSQFVKAVKWKVRLVHARWNCVYMLYHLYTLLSLCASMRIFCSVWNHHKVGWPFVMYTVY